MVYQISMSEGRVFCCTIFYETTRRRLPRICE